MRAAHLTDQRLALPSVSLVTVTSVAIPATARAMAHCLDLADFGQVLWCCDQPPPPVLAGRAEWRMIDRLASRAAYSRFVLAGLAGHIRTSHALLVQWDGYVLDPLGWDPAFLEYDYVGAPWPHFADGMAVGNGGFSLRSRRLLEATERYPATTEAEDVAICRTWRPQLEAENGIRFAPEPVAARFAFERGHPDEATFGFHGAFNLPSLLQWRDLQSLLADLEPQIMAPNEINDLIRAALRSGQFGFALHMIRRKLARWMTGRRSLLPD